MKLQNRNIPVDIKELETLKCPDCKGTIFTTVVQLKKVNQFISPDGQPNLMAIQLFKCDNCDKIIVPENVLN